MKLRTQGETGDDPTPLESRFLDFSLELARPEEKGGVAIILYHPDPSQTYDHGYTSVEARCATLVADRDLVRCSTLGAMDTDAVTILDSMPFIEEDFDGSVMLHTNSHENSIALIACNRLGTFTASTAMICHSSCMYGTYGKREGRHSTSHSYSGEPASGASARRVSRCQACAFVMARRPAGAWQIVSGPWGESKCAREPFRVRYDRDVADERRRAEQCQ